VLHVNNQLVEQHTSSRACRHFWFREMMCLQLSNFICRLMLLRCHGNSFYIPPSFDDSSCCHICPLSSFIPSVRHFTTVARLQARTALRSFLFRSQHEIPEAYKTTRQARLSMLLFFVIHLEQNQSASIIRFKSQNHKHKKRKKLLG
jgi:hypothetical protein